METTENNRNEVFGFLNLQHIDPADAFLRHHLLAAKSQILNTNCVHRCRGGFCPSKMWDIKD